MQVLNQHRTAVIISSILISILIVSIAVLVLNTTSTSPFASPPPTAPASTQPTVNTPLPTSTITEKPSPIATTAPVTPQPTATGAFLLPGEVGQYQGQTLTTVSQYIEYLNEHPDVAIAGVQNLDPVTYRLAITGMVNNPTNFTYYEVVNKFNSTLQVATLPCVEGWSATLLWEGVPLTDLLYQTGVGSDANTLIFLASDGYSSALPLDYVKQNNIMIAYKINNITLTPRTGWPLFLVAKNQYGYKWVEWITEINVSNNSNYLGYWENRGYPNNATVLGGSASSPVDAQLVVSAAVISVDGTAAVASVIYRFEAKRKHKNTYLSLRINPNSLIF
jgi:Sulfite oxidase and related enzymes